MTREPLWMWVIYDHPRDHPDLYVARPQYIDADGVTQFDEGLGSPDLDKLREEMARRGLVCLARHPDDDPVILETWI
jgi:hypothetical protein